MEFKTSKGINLFYEIHGDEKGKEAVAFFNGVMASTNSWELLEEPFKKAGFKIILHDFKGQLKSEKPEGPYTFKEHCEEAKELFEFLGINKLHLIGTSYGGEVALKFAILFPEMVKTISVIDSLSELDPVAKEFVNSWKIFCDTMDGEIFFKGMAPSIYGAEFLENNKTMLSQRAKAIKGNPNNYLQGQKILYDTFVNDVYMTDELHKIVAPTLFIVGEDDILKKPKFSEIMHREVKNSEYVVLPNCGHVAIFEKPKELQSIIFGFISKHLLK